MKHTLTLLTALLLCLTVSAHAAVLKRSDVVFMYQADRDTYAKYGATALAWGSKPTPQTREAAAGLKFFGSVGMVTEFGRYYERFPQTYDQALCRDINGQPVKVPWLTDHQHKGIPFWWCCTQQPQFRQYLRERVVETIRTGADGLHIDDHLGTAGGLWLGTCFCDRCVEGFRGEAYSLPANFNFRDAVHQWLADPANKNKPVTHHPLWAKWSAYHYRLAAAFMRELHELASQTAGRYVPMGANAGLLWPGHLNDYQTLDLFSAEIPHYASGTGVPPVHPSVSDYPLIAYRLADAVGRPLAATASGGDWAYVQERQCHGLVQHWIALGYAACHQLMAPNRQWCHTKEKGTHWYAGPADKFAPLYQFVRQNADLFDNHEAFTDIGVVLPYRSFVKDQKRWFALFNQLAATNLSYRIHLAGDDIVDHPLAVANLDASPVLLIPETNDLLPADLALLEKYRSTKTVFTKPQDVIAAIRPAAQATANGRVRALPRVKPGAAVVHLLNYEYNRDRDSAEPLRNVTVHLKLAALGVPKAASCRLVTPDAGPIHLRIESDTVTVPTLGLWGLLVLENQ